MAVSHKDKLIFIHITKTGGTSIVRALGMGYTLHRPWKTYEVECPDIWKTYHKFACVRNPYDRLVSAYFYMLQLKKKEPRRETPEYVKKYDFNEFIKFIYEEKRVDLSNVFWPQHSWILNHETGEIMVDNVIRFENLVEEMEPYLKGREMVWEKKTERNRDFRFYYKTDREFEMIADLYKRDFALFNYDSENI